VAGAIIPRDARCHSDHRYCSDPDGTNIATIERQLRRARRSRSCYFRECLAGFCAAGASRSYASTIGQCHCIRIVPESGAISSSNLVFYRAAADKLLLGFPAAPIPTRRSRRGDPSSIPQYFGRLIGGLLFRGTRAKKNHDEGVGVRRHRLGAWT
jgi:hypothetical protein